MSQINTFPIATRTVDFQKVIDAEGFSQDAEAARDQAASSADLAQANANDAKVYASVGDLPAVTASDNGTWARVLVDSGVQAWLVVAGEWAFQAWLEGPHYDDVTAFFNSNDTFTAGTYVRTRAESFAYKAVDTATATTVANEGGQAFEVLPGKSQAYHAKAYGMNGDGTDETALLVSAISNLDDGDTLDLNGIEVTVFNSVAGVTSGDAIALSDIPRLYAKTGVTIRNGSIKAANPSVSDTKVRFPTTLTFDGCTDCRVENLTLHSKGKSWGDTDASLGLTKEQRRAFAAQNGGHAFLNVRSIGTKVTDCNFRLCGSVATYYSMSSHDAKLTNCFSNPGSLGYTAYVADSWAGDASVSGFPAHVTYVTDCSASKEGYTYGSKGCVLSEDSDVSIIVNGGFYADAFPNGSGRDLGYAFGASSSQTIVSNAIVENCASIGYAATTNNTDFTYLTVSSVVATGLRKTVHQDEDTSVGRTYAKYTNIEANVVGGSTWSGDGDLTREKTSYLALPNAGNRIGHTFTDCRFAGAEYAIITDNVAFGHLYFSKCQIETNGFLWSIKGLGGGFADQKLSRGIVFDHCAIEDVTALASPYSAWDSISNVFVYVDMTTSTITLNSVRDIESSAIPSPETYVIKYAFPRPDANVETLTASKALKPDSAFFQSLKRTDAAALALLPRPDKHKFMEFKIVNTDTAQDLVIKDYLDGTTYLTLTPGQAATCWNDGLNDYVRLL